jgi:tetratricopeptide (TPR) repeat protein
VEAGLAELAWTGKNPEEARRHFARAAELGSTNPRLYFDYAMVLLEVGEERSAIAPLKKAVDLDPEYQDAQRYLGYSLLRDRQYQQAMDYFGKVKHIKAEQASVFYHGIAYAEFHLEKFDESRKAAELAKKYARNLEETAAAEDILRVLDREKERRAMNSESPQQLVRRSDRPPSASVLGTLRQVDCLGKVVRLRVLSGQQQVLLAIRERGSVAIKGSQTGSVDLTCGLQKGKLVTVEYERREDAALGTIGDVRSIEFQ